MRDGRTGAHTLSPVGCAESGDGVPATKPEQVTTFRWSDEGMICRWDDRPSGLAKWRYAYDRQGHITGECTAAGAGGADTAAPGVAPAGNGGGRGGKHLALCGP
ncbi:hypothetical protein ACVXG8_00590 [Escherichia coli]